MILSGGSRYGAVEMNPASIHEDTGSVPASLRWGNGVAVSCGERHRHGSDPTLLWLWYRLAARAPIPPLTWELKKQKKKKKDDPFLKQLTNQPIHSSKILFAWISDLYTNTK